MPPKKGKRTREQSPGPSDDHEALHCILCIDVVVDAHQSSCCGALLCGRCTAAPSVKERCPHCRHERPDFYKDPFRERQAAAVVLTCKSCDFSGKRDEYFGHVAAGHETPSEKMKRLEETVKRLEADVKEKETLLSRKDEMLKKKDAAHKAELSKKNTSLMKKGEELKTQAESLHAAVLKGSDSIPTILRAALSPRISANMAVIREEFTGQSGVIAQTVDRREELYSVKIAWSHFNVALWVTHKSGRRVNVTLKLLHPDAAQDKTSNILILNDGENTRGFGNWMTIEEMEKFRHCEKYLVFGVGLAA